MDTGLSTGAGCWGLPSVLQRILEGSVEWLEGRDLDNSMAKAISQPLYKYFSVLTTPSGDHCVPVHITPKYHSFSQQGDWGMEKGRDLPDSSRITGGSRRRNSLYCHVVRCSFYFTLPLYWRCGKISFSTYFKPELIKRNFLRHKNWEEKKPRCLEH